MMSFAVVARCTSMRRKYLQGGGRGSCSRHTGGMRASLRPVPLLPMGSLRVIVGVVVASDGGKVVIDNINIIIIINIDIITIIIVIINTIINHRQANIIITITITITSIVHGMIARR